MEMVEALVYVIVLNYNGYEDTKKCIESVLKNTYSNFEVLIVDNASVDDSETRLREDFPQCVVLQTGSNLGYAGGNNVGIKYAVEKEAEYICILNNDTLVAEDMIEILVSHLKKFPQSIVGPATLFWKSNIIHSAGANIDFWRGISNIPYYSEKIENIRKNSISCDYLEGTCLMFSTKYIDTIGLLPEIYFMYFEETEWCWRAKKRGINVVCIPKAKLWHKGSASSNKVSGMKQRLEDRNRIIFEQRNASIAQRIFFFVYVWTQLLFRIITKKRDSITARTYIEGYKINNKE